jgi:hypothetical protein
MRSQAQRVCLVVGILLMAFGAVGAKADSATITASGVWGSGAPTSDWSAAGGTWSMSLTLPNPVNATALNGTMEMSVSDITSFTFSLNGTPVNIAPDDIVFFPASEDGGFDIQFTAAGTDVTNGFSCSASSVCSLNFFGDTLFSGNAPTITILPGSVGTIDFDYTASGDVTNPAGTGTVNTFTVATPEPATLSLLAVGAVGLFLKRRKHSA